MPDGKFLRDNIEAHIRQDEDDFVRKFLAAVNEAKGVLSLDLQEKLARYP